MTAEEAALRLLVSVVEVVLEIVDAAIVRDKVTTKIDEFVVARAARKAAFKAKFGEDL